LLAQVALILGVLLTTGFVQAQDSIAPSTEFAKSAAALETFINAELATKEAPSAAIAVVMDGRIVWAKGFGFSHPDKKINATAETRYPIGSVSKLPTALLCVQLAREGKLNLDDPVTKYIPTFNPKNPFDAPVTIRHLLAHCSGIVREPPLGNYFFPGDVTPKQMVDSLIDTALVYKPGTQYKYSNAALSLAGYIAELVEQKPFEEVAQSRIFRPLGMTRSTFSLTDAIKGEVAAGQGWTRYGKTFPVPTFDYKALAPAGGATASVLDMAKFLNALSPALGEAGPFHPDDIKAAFTRQFPNVNAERTYGLGFVLTEFQGRRQVRHGGDVNGCVTEFTLLPDDRLGVVVFAAKQSATMITRRIAEAALGQALAVKEGKPLPVLQSTAPLPQGTAKALAWRYVSGDETYDVDAQGDRAYLMPASGGTLKEIRSLEDSLIVDDGLSFGTKIKKAGDALAIDGKMFKRVEVPTPPPPPPEKWKGLIGEYGPEFNVLYVLEKDGKLHLLIEWFFLYPLAEESPGHFRLPNSGLYPGEPVVFERKDGKATAAVIAGMKFDRRKLDGEDGATFKIKPVRPIDEIRKEALAATPPVEQGEFFKPDLVNLAFFEPTIKFDIRYAGENNFMSTPMYTTPRAFFQRPAAEAIARAHRKLAEHGFGILVFDTYRPWFVTKMFWEATPERFHNFVADPSKGSRHNRGCAADITLYDLKTGKPVEMVAGYDEFSDRAYPDYPGGTSEQRWRRKLLREAMEAEGFTIYEAEWWHFDYKDWRRYPILNQRFEEIKQ
jgi:CubicO group peptidase (beta-lactamase class C family)/D-alanyl-D-alanine dipeptidase